MRKIPALILVFVLLSASPILFGGCGTEMKEYEPPVIDGLETPEKTELLYAECFSLYEYGSSGTLIVTNDGSEYFTSESKPEDLPDGVVFIKRGTDKVYMAASAVMSFYDALGRVSDIRFSALDENAWDIESAAAAMRSGDMVYAGKYREPDYELLLTGGCELSVQSTMSGHVPKVKQKLTELGIPVFVDRSSYEPEPLGRCEWIKVYARLTGCAGLGDELFGEQKAYFDSVEESEPSGKTAVFFYITSSGSIVTRKSGDYITKMITIAGGKNVFDFIGEDNASSSVTMEPEKFCVYAKDADVIIYNSTIGGELEGIGDLTAKSGFLNEFKAVRNGNVWCMKGSAYQEVMRMGEILGDLHTIFFDGDAELKYLYKLS